MNEQDWCRSTDPTSMLLTVRGKVSERKLRLFVCGCARLLWNWIPVGIIREAIEIGEMNADGLASDEERQMYLTRLLQLPAEYRRSTSRNWYSDHTPEIVSAWCGAVKSCAHWNGLASLPEGHMFGRLTAATGQQQPQLLREIMGDPFRTPIFDPAWGSPTIAHLARTAYDERQMPSGELDPHCLAALADALMDVGCTDAGLLSHLRRGGPHVRGCWAVDLVLDKS